MTGRATISASGAEGNRCSARPHPVQLEDSLLTENEVQRSFSQLFKAQDKVTADTFERAEELLDELRLESPLRHRLAVELEELRSLYATKA